MVHPPTLPTLLVDGYNVIGAWPQLQHLQHTGGLEAARHQLTEVLSSYSAFQGYQTQLIFDAQYRDGPGSSENITDLLQVCFTEVGQNADSYIEIFCARARQQVGRIIVATNDRAQKHMVLGYGAAWISADRLIRDLDVNSQVIRKSQKRHQRSGRSLADSLDPEAKRRLEQLRLGQKSE